MNPRLVNALFGLTTLTAIGAAVYFGVSGTNRTGQETAAGPSLTPLSAPTPILVASPTVSPVASPTPSPSSASATDHLSLPNTVVTLTPGQTLFTVADSHQVTLNQLIKVNAIANPDQVVAGQKIVVPDSVTNSDYTILFAVNSVRLAREKQKISAGTNSIYQNSVSAAIADLSGLFSLVSDTPWSATAPTDTTTTLTTSDDTWIVSVVAQKDADGLWTMSRLTAKLKAKTKP